MKFAFAVYTIAYKLKLIYCDSNLCQPSSDDSIFFLSRSCNRFHISTASVQLKIESNDWCLGSFREYTELKRKTSTKQGNAILLFPLELSEALSI